MDVLISGAGIAGPTLAFWLRKFGFSPTLVETAPALRTSGYVIDFWGLGYDIAEKMGLLPDIIRMGYRMQALKIVDDGGHRLSGLDVQVFRELTNNRYITLGRSDLSRLIYDRISVSVSRFACLTFVPAVSDDLSDGPGVRRWTLIQTRSMRRFSLCST